MDYDCTACGACCAYAPDWPRLSEEELAEVAADGASVPPPEMVTDDHMRWTGARCVALSGTVGCETRCGIYPRRPAVCRACQPGDLACHVARRKHGLPVVEGPSSLEAAFEGGGGRVRLRRG